jgi:hypothetical protein
MRSSVCLRLGRSELQEQWNVSPPFVPMHGFCWSRLTNRFDAEAGMLQRRRVVLEDNASADGHDLPG